MTLDKAIKINKQIVRSMMYPAMQDKRDAILLGIQALKAWKSSRALSDIHHVPLLQGETRVLPTIDEFIGSDPNYTGDMTTEEYIRNIRGKEGDER